jgi:hypothetical protein
MQPRRVRHRLQSPLSGSPDPDAAVKQALSHSVRTAGELPAELSLVRRTRLFLRHREELFGDALRAEWCSRFNATARNQASTNALRLKFQGKTCDKIAKLAVERVTRIRFASPPESGTIRTLVSQALDSAEAKDKKHKGGG